jgi:hypothetical protein
MQVGATAQQPRAAPAPSRQEALEASAPPLARLAPGAASAPLRPHINARPQAPALLARQPGLAKLDAAGRADVQAAADQRRPSASAQVGI